MLTRQHIKKNVILLAFSFVIPLYSTELPIEKRSLYKKMTTSVIIPCCQKHFQHLTSLLTHFANQTVVPDEVIISLSDTQSISSNDIRILKNQSWPFRVQLLESVYKKTAGENRGLAIAHATGDILICQDADDLPHPQRVEIIKYLFQTYDIDHVMHCYTYSDTFATYKLNRLTIIRYATINDLWKFIYGKLPVTNGSVSFTRQLSKEVPYPIKPFGQDLEFNTKVYNLQYKAIIIDAQLIQYRKNLSSNRGPAKFLMQNA